MNWRGRDGMGWVDQGGSGSGLLLVAMMVGTRAPAQDGDPIAAIGRFRPDARNPRRTYQVKHGCRSSYRACDAAATISSVLSLPSSEQAPPALRSQPSQATRRACPRLCPPVPSRYRGGKIAGLNRCVMIGVAWDGCGKSISVEEKRRCKNNDRREVVAYRAACRLPRMMRSGRSLAPRHDDSDLKPDPRSRYPTKSTPSINVQVDAARIDRSRSLAERAVPIHPTQPTNRQTPFWSISTACCFIFHTASNGFQQRTSQKRAEAMRRPPSQALASVLVLLLLWLALVVAPANGFVTVRPAGATMQVRFKWLLGWL